jgi:hypothetical protein
MMPTLVIANTVTKLLIEKVPSFKERLFAERATYQKLSDSTINEPR